MRFRCVSARPVGHGVLEGYKLVFRGGAYGYLTVEPCEGSSVPIGVWEIDELDEHNLDLYEGYPEFYRKEIVKIPVTRFKSSDSSVAEEIEGMIYLMNDGYKFARPTNDYIRTCGLPGYLILFAPHAFEPQCQLQSSEPPSPPVFLLISTHFTATLGIPLTPPAL